eukprot:TRINITY_DN23788_c0_g1_i1.p1 TRINITY_DN23788_c0_g1~~TRINITY_DN23788_c0_g1_i1.p1  ORF type:complete len:140 (-),score=11.28 TRINITY_DN23788_c0_g1_i1:48-467(-)
MRCSGMEKQYIELQLANIQTKDLAKAEAKFKKEIPDLNYFIKVFFFHLFFFGSTTTASVHVIAPPVCITVDVGDTYQHEIHLSRNPMVRTFSEFKASILSLGTTKTSYFLDVIYRKAPNDARVLISGDAKCKPYRREIT